MGLPESRQHLARSGAETEVATWKVLYQVGGVAALLAAAIIPIAIIVYFVSPPPSTVIDYFTLFQNSKLLGLLAMDLLLIVGNVFGLLLLLALYVALRRASESWMAIALALGLVGVAAYFASNTAFNMLSLSDQYAAATTDGQRAMFLAAGQAMLAIYNGTAFHVSYVIGAVAFLIIAVVMLRSNLFSRAAAYLGIAANVIALGLYVPTIGIYISIFSVLFLFIWYILIAQRLLQLARQDS
jgi:hypothetical protein